MKGRSYPAILGWILGTLFALLLAAAMAHATPPGREVSPVSSAVVLRPAGVSPQTPGHRGRRGGFCKLFHVEQFL
jgi:hypothetical protein